MLDEVEKLKPVNLTKWENSEGQVEGDGEQLGLAYDEMVKFSGLSKEAFWETYLSWVEGTLLTPRFVNKTILKKSLIVEATHFHIYKRAKHVFSEALRVLQFRDVCLSAASSST